MLFYITFFPNVKSIHIINSIHFFLILFKRRKSKKKIIAVDVTTLWSLLFLGIVEQNKSQTRSEQVNKLMIILRIVFNELKRASLLWMCRFEWKAKNQIIPFKRKVEHNIKKM